MLPVFNPPQPQAQSASSRSVVRPALAGGIVGAVIASAVLGAALVATRRDNNARSTTAAVVASPAVDRNTVSAAAPVSLGSALPIRDVLTKVEPAVVSVNTRGFDPNGFFGVDPQQGAGTGIVLTADGYVLTNNHVIDGAQQIKVTFADRKVRTAQVVGRDATHDVAIIKVDGAKNLPIAVLGSSKALQVGDPVVAIGNALALPGGPTVTTGIVSALERTIDGDTNKLEGLVQTDAAINPGNSGGPLVNSAGEVVGMNTAILRNTNNIGFAIAVDRIKPIVDKIRRGEATQGGPRTFLGVSTQTMSTQLKDQYGLNTDRGALVVQVTPGSPAENAGLRPGDIITKFGGAAITSNEQLGGEVRKRKSGDKASTTWLRGTQSTTADVTLGSARTVVEG